MINCTQISSAGVFQNVFFPGILKETLNEDVSYWGARRLKAPLEQEYVL